MALHLSRTLALKAAGLMAVVLIFFNLIGLRLEIKFDRSALHSMNLTSHTSSLQWPKRTHTNHHHQIPHSPVTSTTTNSNNNNTINKKPISSELNLLNQNATMKISQNQTFSDNSTIHLNSTSNLLVNNNNNNNEFVSEKGDINGNHSISEKVLRSNDDNNNNNNKKGENNNILAVTTIPTTAAAAAAIHVTKTKTKKTKYQDFDASLVKEDGILNSIMKVFGLNQCPATPPNLVGPIKVDTSADDLVTVEKSLSTKVQSGGRYKPTECRPRDRVAIVIPYRDRKQHLPILMKNLHPFLMKQQIDYGIFLVEQSSDGSFNRAKLMNIGFVEALKIYEWDCFIFHDVDLLPMDDRNLYNCPTQPRHMSVAIDTFKWQLPYSSIFGGVSSMTTKQFKAVNGFSNSYYGWGGEDDDLSKRLKHEGYHIARYPVNIARYTMLTHKKEKPNPKRYEKLVTGANRFTSDGLNSLKYKLLDLQAKPLYTWIYVDITPDSS